LLNRQKRHFLDYGRRRKHAGLERRDLEVIEQSEHLPRNRFAIEMSSTSNLARVLKRHAGYCRDAVAVEIRHRPEIGQHPGSSRRIVTGDCHHRNHSPRPFDSARLFVFMDVTMAFGSVEPAKSFMPATPPAPLASTDGMFDRLMPPSASTGIVSVSMIALSESNPAGGPNRRLLSVSKTGPNTMKSAPSSSAALASRSLCVETPISI